VYRAYTRASYLGTWLISEASIVPVKQVQIYDIIKAVFIGWTALLPCIHDPIAAIFGRIVTVNP